MTTTLVATLKTKRRKVFSGFYSEMIEPGEIGKLLQIQKAALENFILRLGPAAKNPVDLKKYA
jgi:hypothetical protein